MTSGGRAFVLAAAVAAVLMLIGSFALPGRQSDEQRPAAGPEAAAPATQRGFVERDGTRLTVDGSTYRFVGFNTYVLFGCGHPEEDINGADREEFFSALRPGGVVRLFLLPGTDLADFDEVVGYAAEHGQRLVVVLSDHHGECGDVAKDDEFYDDGFRGDYLEWVEAVVPAYRDEPTIAMWELMNEPRTSDPSTLRAFFDEAGGVVHRLAPHHLVSSGTLQPDTLGGPEAFLEVSQSPGIDVVSLHEYDAVDDASHHLAPALEAAEAVDKPLMLGEWGLYAGLPGADEVNDTLCYSVEDRAEVAEAKLEAYLDVPEVAGALYWSFMADGAAPGDETCTLSTTSDDPLTTMIRNIPIPVPE
ncbi:cellulase family glycosylhydrolase [Pseudonocardia kunmingensis]|uniref:mannan endo-1,4-beta-mannosidase n=1 Tax=Pseudonocardia kunmingensis TaxID=630975 RepID=A0A543DZT6_9PSEU|nr:cellulase family glycosylhydrolase [Pseudonocardia kunmingensis]TQM14759.1 cellulase (glycosyl hydrolase family 5) [Pseudonocardia kunmingensis]